jgi:catechol 2,3-dioxygenase-like lactoylglutathione lyase family enzyme
MKPRINFVTLGVADLERALRFYRDGLKLKTDGIIGAEFGKDAEVVFIQMNPGLTLALWRRTSLMKESQVTWDGDRPAGFSLAHNVGSKAEVDAVLAEAKAAGATLPVPASDKVWGGYTGYFQDPDGHLWEVAWNPELKLQD